MNIFMKYMKECKGLAPFEIASVFKNAIKTPKIPQKKTRVHRRCSRDL